MQVLNLKVLNNNWKLYKDKWSKPNERERDVSMHQLAAEKIRASNLESHCSSLKYTHDVTMTQFTDLVRHAATQGVCHDIHWSNQAPEGFAEFVETWVQGALRGPF
eukprot:5220193-Amphidinium_carterae.3